MSADTLKTQICDALAAFIRQRPGLDFADYGDVKVYRSEARSIARDKRDAETLLQAVRWRDSITSAMLEGAAKSAFSGRLSLVIVPGTQERAKLLALGKTTVRIDYCTGQYWPTEYRKAVAAVCARALWECMRDNMPQADGTADHDGDGAYDGMSAGDWLRRNARREFGSKLQRRWFN